jgi:hypothetical protein
LPEFERNRIENSMEPLYPQNILERTFPHLREMREKAEREAKFFPSGDKRAIKAVESFEVGEEAGLYSAVPHESGAIGWNLSTFA